jgi:hypothetical protein
VITPAKSAALYRRVLRDALKRKAVVMALTKERIAELRADRLLTASDDEALELLDSAERVIELEAEGTRVEAYVVELQVQVRKLEAELAAARAVALVHVRRSASRTREHLRASAVGV